MSGGLKHDQPSRFSAGRKSEGPVASVRICEDTAASSSNLAHGSHSSNCVQLTRPNNTLASQMLAAMRHGQVIAKVEIAGPEGVVSLSNARVVSMTGHSESKPLHGGTHKQWTGNASPKLEAWWIGVTLQSCSTTIGTRTRLKRPVGFTLRRGIRAAATPHLGPPGCKRASLLNAGPSDQSRWPREQTAAVTPAVSLATPYPSPVDPHATEVPSLTDGLRGRHHAGGACKIGSRC